MKTKPVMGILVAIFIVTNCGSQATAQSKKLASKRSFTPFVCPDPEAKQSCASYKELLRAKDAGLPSAGYVCFRKNVDEFFVFKLSEPYFHKHWDSKSKRMVIDDNSGVPAHGITSSYKDGILDSDAMPGMFFSGVWRMFQDQPFFYSDRINFERTDAASEVVMISPKGDVGAVDESKVEAAKAAGWKEAVKMIGTDGKETWVSPDRVEEAKLAGQTISEPKGDKNGVSVDERQLSIDYKYQSKTGKSVQYRLTIQVSTRRFSESFREASDQVPFLEHTGYCVYRKAP
jgi:hypothetical protein